MSVIQPPVIFSIFTQHLIRIFALEVLARRFDISMAGHLGGLIGDPLVASVARVRQNASPSAAANG
jgi:hypothetical protein